MTKYHWTVQLSDGSSQSGAADSFANAIKALQAWYGDGDGAPAAVSYLIVPYYH